MGGSLILSALTCATALLAQSKVDLNVRYLVGLEAVQQNVQGKLTTHDGKIEFSTGSKSAAIPITSICDINVGSETTQGGGKAGKVAGSVAAAAPLGSGDVLVLALRTKVDVVTLWYRDADNGLHAAILEVAKGGGEALKNALTAGGAQIHPLEQSEPVHVTSAASGSSHHPASSAIQIELIQSAEARVAPEFRAAIYEFAVERLGESGVFQHVLRSGSRSAGSYPDLVTLHTAIQKFSEGSQAEREITLVLGDTKLDVNASITGRDGQTVWEGRASAKVRFTGENLSVTDDVAKRLAKLLQK
jgi:hypothetical protein